MTFSITKQLKLAEVSVGISGGVIWIVDNENPLFGTTITTPAGAFTEPTTLTISQVDNVKSGFLFKPISAAIKIETDTGKDPTSYIDITMPYSTVIHDQYDLSKIATNFSINQSFLKEASTHTDKNTDSSNTTANSSSSGFVIFKNFQTEKNLYSNFNKLSSSVCFLSVCFLSAFYFLLFICLLFICFLLKKFSNRNYSVLGGEGHFFCEAL